MRQMVVAALRATSVAGGAATVPPVAPKGAPPKATPRSVAEDHFGRTVVDRYRYMESKGAETVALIKEHGGTPYAIDRMTPSRDGSRIAVGISAGGSENSQMAVLDASTGKTIAGPQRHRQTGWRSSCVRPAQCEIPAFK